MTFAAHGVKGQAVAVPCAKQCTPNGITEEAEALWIAEQPTARLGRIAADWGCVAALFPPSGEAKNSQSWSAFFSPRAKPIWPTRDSGLLDIPWPNRLSDGKPYEADFLLATATLATEQPSSEQIADAWVNQDDGHESYFFGNVRHHIRTADDLSIWKRIKKRNPEWLSRGTYTQAMATLDAELA